jgi:hypothetical protein
MRAAHFLALQQNICTDGRGNLRSLSMDCNEVVRWRPTGYGIDVPATRVVDQLLGTPGTSCTPQNDEPKTGSSDAATRGELWDESCCEAAARCSLESSRMVPRQHGQALRAAVRHPAGGRLARCSRSPAGTLASRREMQPLDWIARVLHYELKSRAQLAVNPEGAVTRVGAGRLLIGSQYGIRPHRP